MRRASLETFDTARHWLLRALGKRYAVGATSAQAYIAFGRLRLRSKIMPAAYFLICLYLRLMQDARVIFFRLSRKR